MKSKNESKSVDKPQMGFLGKRKKMVPQREKESTGERKKDGERDESSKHSINEFLVFHISPHMYYHYM